MAYTLPELPYGYNALEPHFDTETMQIHHSKHHNTYIDKLNAVLTNQPDFQNLPIDDLLKKFNDIPSEVQTAVKNHGGGHANHSLFWKILSPEIDQLPDGELATAIQTTFTSFGDFQSKFTESALSQFGSGWAWLVVTADKNLAIVNSPNQDSPLMNNQTPILGIDVWEHAYYLKYQNKRADYISAFWHLVNWPYVSELYNQALNSQTTEADPHHS